jgi:hypothetical protein
VNANNGDIVAETLTDQNIDDSSQVEPLLNQIDGEIGQVTADGAYDGKPTYRAVLEHSDTAYIVIPPRSTAVGSGSAGPPGQRDKHITAIARDGRLQWQAATGYGKRSLIETAIGRYKGLIGRRLRARSFPTQQTEGHCNLNFCTDAGVPSKTQLRSPGVGQFAPDVHCFVSEFPVVG